MNKEEVIKLMKSSKTEAEWDANCDTVKRVCNGYPPFWFSAIVMSGVAAEVMARFGKDDKIHIVSTEPESKREKLERELEKEKGQDVELILASVSMVTLHNFDNAELSALNLAIQLQGKVPKENLAFNKALDYKLIDDNGTVYDLNALKRACTCEVNARVKTGTFN